MTEFKPPSQPRPPHRTRGDDEAIARIWRTIHRRIAVGAGGRTVRAGDPGWQHLRTGVLCKVLHEQGGMFSYLLQLSPGACVPAGRSSGEEEWVVLQGSLRIGEVVIDAGDYHVDLRGTVHGALCSDCGALVFLRAAPLPMLTCPM